jgi:deoxyadenosine/deoxycytidine kinase
MLIVVDGMTAAGKTTIVELLAGRLGFEVMQEEFRDKFDLLNRFSQDSGKWCFPMQLNFLITRYAQFLVATEGGDFILDRSIYSDLIYGQLYRDMSLLSEKQFSAYKHMYTNMIENLPEPDCIVLLQCPFDEIVRRIVARGRSDEIALGRDYWRGLYRAYENFAVSKEMTVNGLLRIDSERYNFLDSEEDKDTVVRLVSDICNMHYGVSEA